MPTDAHMGPTVTVTGIAVLRAEPDEAALSVTIDALKDDPGSALADVAARSEALVALLDELGIAAARRATTGVTVHEDFDHTSAGRRSLGHRASSTVIARTTDPGVIGALLTRATSELAARVDGPHWRIAPENPVHLHAARDAAAVARSRAQAYAAGVGSRLGEILGLSEPSTSIARRTVSGGKFVPLAASAGPPMPVEAGEHEVVAVVEATFALQPAPSAPAGPGDRTERTGAPYPERT